MFKKNKNQEANNLKQNKKAEKQSKKNSNKKAEKTSAFLVKKVAFSNCYEKMGIIETLPNVFTRAYEIKVPDKEMLVEYDVNHIRECMKEILAQFVQQYTMQIMVQNSKVAKEEYLDAILLQPSKEDKVNAYIKDYNDIIKDNIDIGHNNYRRTVYFIISTKQPSADDALSVFERVDVEVKRLFEKMYEYEAAPLTLNERLLGLRKLFNPDDNTSLDDFARLRETSDKTPVKELIYPKEYDEKNRDYLIIGKKYIRNLFINSLPSAVPDSVLNDLMRVSSNSILSVIYEPLDTELARNTANALVKKNTLITKTAIRDTVEDRKARRVMINEKPIIEGEEQYFEKEAQKFFQEAQDKGESVMLATFVISLFADSLDALNRDTTLLGITASKYASQIKCCDLRQTEAFQTALPLGVSRLNAYRAFTNGQLAAIQPLDIQQLFNKQKSFLGLNEISDNLILLDRKPVPTGIICGIEHSGKTFQMKREIANTLMTTDDEVVVITHNMDIYKKFIDDIGGEQIELPHPDFFTGKNAILKKQALVAFVASRNEIQKMRLTEEEKVASFDAIEKEAEMLMDCKGWNEAVMRINTSKDKFPAIIKALRKYKPTLKISLESSQCRLKIIEADSQSDIICALKDVYQYARKKVNSGKTVWLYVDGIESLFYLQPTSDYLVSFTKAMAQLKCPETYVIQDTIRVITNTDAKIEFDFFLKNVNYFKLLSQGPIERKMYIEKLNIPDSLHQFITEREPGEGIIITPSVDVAFNDRFESRDNPFYSRFYK